MAAFGRELAPLSLRMLWPSAQQTMAASGRKRQFSEFKMLTKYVNDHLMPGRNMTEDV